VQHERLYQFFRNPRFQFVGWNINVKGIVPTLPEHYFDSVDTANRKSLSRYRQFQKSTALRKAE
jgi:hypothetical protein